MFSPIRIDAENPSPMTGSGNATYLLAAAGGDALLVDAGVGEPRHLDHLQRQLTEIGARLDTVAVTHGPGDHASGAPAVAARFPGASFTKYPWRDDENCVQWAPLHDGDRLPAGDETLIVLHTPGHSPDHLAFWHEESRTVLTGDLVISGSSVMIDWSHGGDLAQYLRSLERLLGLEPVRLLPAHGAVIDKPAALLRTYIDHRLLRERQVLAALGAGLATVPEIAESIYHGLAAALMPAARETVRAHLEKLRQDGRAAEEHERWLRQG
jgi:glyoxylase-like metal-dependent hydrolase (beta-lactamase superfamily II)